MYILHEQIPEIKYVRLCILQDNAIIILYQVTQSEETCHNTKDHSIFLNILLCRKTELRAVLETCCSFPLIPCCVTEWRSKGSTLKSIKCKEAAFICFPCQAPEQKHNYNCASIQLKTFSLPLMTLLVTNKFFFSISLPLTLEIFLFTSFLHYQLSQSCAVTFRNN